MSNARAIYGLTGTGTPTSTNVAGSMLIGVEQTQSAFATADIVYSFKVTGNGTNDVATLTLSSGVVAQTTGTPAITDGDGKDFEGSTLPAMVTGYAILVKSSGTTVQVTSSFASNPDIILESASTVPLLCPFVMNGTIDFTLADSSASVTVTVVGKSS